MRTTKFWSSTSITSSRYAKRCPRRESVASTCAHGTKRRHRTVVRSRIPTSQRRSKRSCGRSMQHSIPCASSRNLRSSRRNYSLFKNSTETGNSNLLTVPLLNELQRRSFADPCSPLMHRGRCAILYPYDSRKIWEKYTEKGGDRDA